MTTATLPSRTDEAWRWAGLDALTRAAAAPRLDATAPDWLDLDGPRLVFVDGVYDATRSDPREVQVGHVDIPTDHPLGNRARDGWTLTVPAGRAVTNVQLLHVANGGENHVAAQVTLAEDAVASIVESFAGTGWTNRLSGYALAKGARLMRAVRLLQDDGFVSLRDEGDVGEGASLASHFLAAGGAGCRIDGALTLNGDAAFADYGGALLTREEERKECAVAVRHVGLSGSSRQTWRAVAADRSAASLAARVEVARGAQQTDGEQSLRGLLLHRTATVNLKPELEIFADDVKCAHGATVGELDARALFYLESRGIAPGRARALMTRAFVADALDRIGDEGVRDAFAADADAWLANALEG